MSADPAVEGADGAVVIRAAVLDRPGAPVRVESVLLDPPGPGEVRVRVAAAGVCHSDLHLADGHLGAGRSPMVLGHEGTGTVERVGAGVEGLRPGDRVAFTFIPPCDACPPCLAGRVNLCRSAGAASYAGTMLDGTRRLRRPDGTALQHGLLVACFAEATVVPAGAAIRVPDSLPSWQAALLGCGAITGFGAVRNAARVRPGASACVIGCGGVGLQVVAALRLAGARRIVAVDRQPDKLDRALRRGATDVIPADDDTAARVVALTDGGVDHAFEVVGRTDTIRLAWDVTRAGGEAIVVGLAPVGVDAVVPAIELLSEKALRGCYYGSGDVRRDIPDLVGLALAGDLALDDVVSHTVDLDGVDEALGRLRRGEGARTVVLVDPGVAVP